MRNLDVLTTLAAVVAGLSACGGGGGDADSTDPVPDAGPVAISRTNAQTVARQSTKAANDMADSSRLVTGAQVSQDGRALMAYSRGMLGRLPGLFARAPGMVMGVTTSENVACTGGRTTMATTKDEQPSHQQRRLRHAGGQHLRGGRRHHQWHRGRHLQHRGRRPGE